jgi:hypothetical protein
MIKLFGVADLITAVLLFLIGFKTPFPKVLVLIFGIYLLCKSAAFIMNFISIIDLAIAVLMILFYYSVITLPGIIPFLLGVFLGQKAIFSLL